MIVHVVDATCELDRHFYGCVALPRDRREKNIRDAQRVRDKFGVEPRLIPDFLALVGDVADG